MGRQRLFIQMLKGNKIIVIFTILINLTSSILMSYAGYSLIHIFEAFNVEKGQALNQLIQDGIYVLGVWLVALIVYFLKEVMESKYVQKMRNSLCNHIANKVVSMEFNDYDDSNSGIYISWFTNDVNDLNSKSINSFINFWNHFFTMISTFVALLLLNVYIGLGAIGFLLLNAILPQIFSMPMIKANRKLTYANEQLTEGVRDNINGFNIFFIK